MKRQQSLAIIGTFLLFFFFNLPFTKAQIEPDSKEFVAAVDSIFADRADMTAPGALVIVMKGNKHILSKSYGSSNIAFGLPFNENTIFPLPGFTEQLVVFSLLQLEQKGLLNLKDPVNKYFPEFGFENQVSLSHLLNHSSGLPVIGSLRLMAGWNFSDPFTQDDFLNLTKKFTGDLKPDVAFSHNHTGIRILMMVVEKVSKMDLAEYVSTNIFAPLGMTNTFIKNKDVPENKNMSVGYNPTDNGFQKASSTEFAIFCPTAYSTQQDFEKWMLNVQTRAFEGAIMERLDQALMADGKLQERVNRAYCIGQHQYYKFLGQDEFYFMDVAEGHSWKWIRLKQSELSILAISNWNASVSSKVNTIARLMTPPTPSTPEVATSETTPIQLSEKELQAYTGFFWDDRYLFTTQISIKDGSLYYEDLHNGWNFALTPLSKTLFESPPWNKVEFSDLDGQKKLKLILRDGRELPSNGYDPNIIKVKDYPRFTGTYTSDKLNAFYKVVVVDNRLFLRRSRKPDLELIPIGYNKFRADEIDFRVIEFQEDKQQSIQQMTISNTVIKDVKFRKI